MVYWQLRTSIMCTTKVHRPPRDTVCEKHYQEYLKLNCVDGARLWWSPTTNLIVKQWACSLVKKLLYSGVVPGKAVKLMLTAEREREREREREITVCKIKRINYHQPRHRQYFPLTFETHIHSMSLDPSEKQAKKTDLKSHMYWKCREK